MSRGTELLRHLILLRHDPELVAELAKEAWKGDRDAQYGLGLVYAEGRGVEADPIEACAWLTLACLEGDRDAEELRDLLMRDMDGDAIQAARERAADYAVRLGRERTRH